jgi:hypothetical protein
MGFSRNRVVKYIHNRLPPPFQIYFVRITKLLFQAAIAKLKTIVFYFSNNRLPVLASKTCKC